MSRAELISTYVIAVLIGFHRFEARMPKDGKTRLSDRKPFLSFTALARISQRRVKNARHEAVVV